MSEQNIFHILDNNNTTTTIPVATRFPPEPNGHLHLGHAKAMFINFGYADLKKGTCYLRFDDTNPNTEKQEYIDSIQEDVNWLGYTPTKITYTSDYFEQLYNLAIQMIKLDRAYVCELDQKTVKENRRDKIESPYRNRPISESLKLLEDMKKGRFEEGSMTLRMKMDMNSNNPNMRDFVAYRIIYTTHPRSGTKYCIYPSYDYSHCIVDSLEKITHSLCSIEFQSRNEPYSWILDTLDIFRSKQIEYSRLNMTHTLLSKRKLLQLVSEKLVSGWDDPRMPTLKGLKRKGYTPEAIRSFCQKIGISVGGSGNLVRYEILENCLREDLERKVPRAFAVIDPLLITITNWNKPDEELKAYDFPFLGDNSSTHVISFEKHVYINRSDFRLQDDPKYYGLAPGKVVRLKYAHFIKCLDVQFDKEKKIIGLLCEYSPTYDKKVSKVKGIINWVGSSNIKITVNEYDHLFPEVFEQETDWLSQLNNNSLKTYSALADLSIKNVKAYDKVQFERLGYFSVDPTTTPDHIVFNKCASLYESVEKRSL